LNPKRPLRWTAHLAVVLFAVPVLVWAYSTGPIPYAEGGPGGDPRACTQCHGGTALNRGGGKVELLFPGDRAYVPGQKQRIRIVITDPSARVYGYQVSARLASNELTGQAGIFTALGPEQQVVCGDLAIPIANRCRASAPIQFLSHTTAGTASTIDFDWTPPAIESGDIVFYVAANGADASRSTSGDHIYTARYTLRSASGLPFINPETGVTNGASFVSGMVSGAWISIFGSSLSTTTRDWSGAIGLDGAFPTSLDGVSVQIDGKPAFVYYVSPNQLNVQAPDLEGKTGPLPVVVRTRSGASLAQTATAYRELPGLFTYVLDDRTFVAAVKANGNIIGPAGYAGVTPAQPGEIVQLFGTGFGPTDPAVTPGRVFTGSAPLVDRVRVRIGGILVTPTFQGLVSSGLYQLNVQVPPGLGSGEHLVDMSINSVSIPSGIVIPVQRP
jgi:uncharacterized protein (TIGR03437 family)